MHRKRSIKKTYAIVLDGDNERWYFQQMKQEENLNVNIEPQLHQKGPLRDSYLQVCKLADMGYTKVYWLIDLDVEIKNNAIQELRSYHSKLSKYNNVELLFNNPCIEYWYLLHEKDTGKYFKDYDSLIKELKKCNEFNAYSKHYKDYKDLYRRLKPKQSDAILRAKKLNDFSFDNPQTAKADVYQVVVQLLNI